MFNNVRGTFDILPKELAKYNFITTIAKNVVEKYGYQELQTPILEEAGLYSKSLGDSEVVSKEMYTFESKGSDKKPICLRPEGTAAVVRCFNNNANANQNKFYYTGPMFRYERPQKGRSRQFHQFGVECFGSQDVFHDVNSISMATQILSELNLQGTTQLNINSIGDLESRNNYVKILKEFFEFEKQNLSPDSQIRLQKGSLLRILDSKDKGDQKIIENIPPLYENLNQESKNNFDSVLTGLENLNIPYVLNKNLVRGLDYYSNTVFEFTNDKLGPTQNAVLGGGRYDGLIKLLGGKDEEGFGWAFGLDRLVLLLNENDENLISNLKIKPIIFILLEENENYKNKISKNKLILNSIINKTIKEISILKKKNQKNLNSNSKFQILYYYSNIKNLSKIIKNIKNKFNDGNEILIYFGENEIKNQKIVLKNVNLNFEKEINISELSEIINTM